MSNRDYTYKEAEEIIQKDFVDRIIKFLDGTLKDMKDVVKPKDFVKVYEIVVH